MNKKKYLIVLAAVLAVLLVIGLGLLIYRFVNPQVVDKEVAKVAYISITDHGFVPSEITVDRGTSVVWRNETTDPHQIASNPYPERDDLPSLNSDSHLQPSSEYSYTFDKTGTFGYHDYLRPTTSAKITVVEQ